MALFTGLHMSCHLHGNCGVKQSTVERKSRSTDNYLFTTVTEIRNIRRILLTDCDDTLYTLACTIHTIQYYHNNSFKMRILNRPTVVNYKPKTGTP